jgi:integrase
VAFIEARKHTNGGNSWRVIWRTNGQRETERFTNETDADKFKVYVEAAGNNWPPGWIPQQGWAGSFEPPAPTPSVTTTQFVSDSARRRVKASEGTRAGYQLEIERYLKGTDLGLTPWREVTADNVSDWVLILTARGLSAKTVINVHGLTSAAWKQAIKAGDTVINPFDGLAPKNRKLSEDIAVYLTPEQFRIIWEATPIFYQPFVHCLAATGVRISELTALTVNNVDSEGSLIRIRQAWKKTAKPRVYALGEPKTLRGRRTVTVDPLTLSILMTAVEGKKPTDYVFTNKSGTALNYDHFYRNIWTDIVNELPVAQFPRRPRIHDLRHSHASWLIGAGCSLLEISRRLGHESVNTTAGTYGHLFPDAESGLATVIGSLMVTD